MSRRASPTQSGGVNSCRANAKHACNYGNIRSGKCPGYIVRTRNSRMTDAAKKWRREQNPPIPDPPVDDNGKVIGKYYLEWKGNPRTRTIAHGRSSARGFWYTGQQELVGMIGADEHGKVRNDPKKLQEWNDRRCLPHTTEGEIRSGFRNKDPNWLCEVYDRNKERREQKGCVATQKEKTIRGIYRKGPKERKGTPYQSHRTRGERRRPQEPERRRSEEEQLIDVAALSSGEDEDRFGPESPLNLDFQEWSRGNFFDQARELGLDFGEASRSADDVFSSLEKGDEAAVDKSAEELAKSLESIAQVDPETAARVATSVADAIDQEEEGEKPYQEIDGVPEDIENLLNRFPKDLKTEIEHNRGMFKDYYRPVQKTLPAGGPKVWIYENKHYNLVKVSKGGHDMVGLRYVGETPIKKGQPLFLPYTGKPLNSEPANQDYILTIGDKGPIIDSNPGVAKVGKSGEKPWVIGLSAFANEPGPGQEPNADFAPWGNAGALVAKETIRTGDEVLICYGVGYEKRAYPTSCYWTATEDLGREGIMMMNDNAQDGVPVHWPVVEGKLKPFAKLVNEKLCKGLMLPSHIEEGLTDKNAKIMVWTTKAGSMLRGILVVHPGENGEQLIDMMCTKKDYGRKMFQRWLDSKFRTKGPVRLHALPEALKFWHKLGFRVVDRCNEAEPKVLWPLLRDYRFFDWGRIGQTSKRMKQIYDYITSNKEDAELKPFLIFHEKDKLDGVIMRWCDGMQYKGEVAPDVPETIISVPSRSKSLPSRAHSEPTKTKDVTELTEEESNELHTQGYTVLKHAFNVDPRSNYFKELEKFADESAGIIFNTPGKNDKRRSQVELTGSKAKVKMSKPTQRFTEHIWSKLQKMFPEHTPNDMVVLRSDDGCKPQKPHQDYRSKDLWPANKPLIANNQIPLGVIVALMDDTYLDVWPASIGDVSKIKGIKPKRLKFNRGDMVIFRGDLVHGGSSYDNYNIRIHTYMDHPRVKRKANSTQFVKDMACILGRNASLAPEELPRFGSAPAKLEWEVPKKHHQLGGVPVGLDNSGVSCYQNATVQLLYNLPDVMDYVSRQKDRVYDQLLPIMFVGLVKEMRKTVAPHSVPCCKDNGDLDTNKALGSFIEATQDVMGGGCGRQHDAHEFLGRLVQSLMRNGATYRALADERREMGPGELHPSIKLLRQHPIGKLLGMVLRTTVVCPKRGKMADRLDPEFTLPLPMPPRKDATLEGSLKRYIEKQKLTGDNVYRPVRNAPAIKDCERQVLIDASSTYLFLSLMRFTAAGLKLNSKVNIPERIDIGPYTTSKKSSEYELIGVACQSGGTKRGHYVAFVKRAEGWFLCNDSRVSGPMSFAQIKSDSSYSIDTEGYLFCYAKVGGKRGGARRRVILPPPISTKPKYAGRRAMLPPPISTKPQYFKPVSAQIMAHEMGHPIQSN